MSAAVDVIMTNNSNGKQFHFRGVVPFNRKRSQPTINVPLMSTTEANTFLFRFSGQSGIADFTFALFNDGFDCANGTHTSTVITVQQQIQYLFDNFFSEEYDTDWSLLQSEFYSAEVTGVITDMQVAASTSASLRIGTMSFQRGNIGNI